MEFRLGIVFALENECFIWTNMSRAALCVDDEVKAVQRENLFEEAWARHWCDMHAKNPEHTPNPLINLAWPYDPSRYNERKQPLSSLSAPFTNPFCLLWDTPLPQHLIKWVWLSSKTFKVHLLSLFVLFFCTLNRKLDLKVNVTMKHNLGFCFFFTCSRRN